MSVKLVVTDLEDLEFIPVRERPRSGAKAVRMTHDFEFPSFEVAGVAGEWVVEHEDGIDVLSDADFKARYQRVLARKAKPKAAAAE